MGLNAEERLNQQLNPLLGPVPADETGPGASFAQATNTSSVSKTNGATSSTSPITPPQRASPTLSSNNPFRKTSLDAHQSHGAAKQTSATTTYEVPSPAARAYPSPPQSSSPRRSVDQNYRAELRNAGSSRPRRSSSLKERFPGDTSIYPLDQLAREKAKADKAKHMRKHHHIAPDTIDNLDSASIAQYHHEGPYDATLLARNNSHSSSPLAAVASTNAEALKATPHEKIVDSVKGHRPLEGVAAYPPGVTDPEGRTYHYQEGENMMVDLNPGGGPYKRWPGIDYHPDDIKGKGEPSYSIEEALKHHRIKDTDDTHRLEEVPQSIEMQSRNGPVGDATSSAYTPSQDETSSSDLHRRESLGGKLKRRIGSLRRKDRNDDY